MVETETLENAVRYAQKIRDSYKTNGIFLFGSRVNGTSHIDSDIDIAVILDDYSDKMEIMLDLMRLRRKIDSRIEPHPFRKSEFNKNDKLALEILKYGLEI